MLLDLGFLFQTAYFTFTTNHLTPSRKNFRKHSSRFNSPTAPLSMYLDNYLPHSIKRAGSWTNSLYFYLVPVYHLILLLSANLQLSVMLSIHNTSHWICSRSYFHAKPPAHLLYLCGQYFIIYLENISSVWTNYSKASSR